MTGAFMAQQRRIEPPFASLDPALGLRLWADQALRLLEREKKCCGETPAFLLKIAAFPGLNIVLKDETAQPSGSLKHRLARSLFEAAIATGDIGPRTHVIEASSGSTAVSEAYFARLLGLRFSAVMPRGTSADKIAAVRALGGECVLTETPCQISATASALAANDNGYFMNQFANAAHVTNWRDKGTIAAEMLRQTVALTGAPADMIVLGAGTGGTLTTFGRHARHFGLDTRFCLADPQSSAFHRAIPESRAQWREGCSSSVIEGIGRPKVEPSFFPRLVDRCEVVPDEESLAAMRWLSLVLGRTVGGSTGTGLAAALRIAHEGHKAGPLTIGLLICDPGARYARTLHDDSWLEARGLSIAAAVARLEAELGVGTISARNA